MSCVLNMVRIFFLAQTDISGDEIQRYYDLFTLPSVNFNRRIECIIKGDVLDINCGARKKSTVNSDVVGTINSNVVNTIYSYVVGTIDSCVVGTIDSHVISTIDSDVVGMIDNDCR